MKSTIWLTIFVLLSATVGLAQLKNAKTETVKIYGNCSICEVAIEKAANKKKLSKANWNKDSKMATITYDSVKTTMDAVLKDIALAGYDNERFLAPDAVYNQLQGCCKYEREKKQASLVIHPVKDTGSVNHAVTSSAEEQAEYFAAVFESYFVLKDALVKTDGNTASIKAKELETAINAISMNKLPAIMHTVWMKIADGLREDAEHINGTKDISHQRNHFMSLSKNMYELLKAVKQPGSIYYQFCPMANNGKGANWLSRDSGIKNPYYGAQMLTCGKTVETIK